MRISTVLELGQIGQKVDLNGWVSTVRTQKQINFINLNDGSNSKGIQVIFDKNDESESFSKLQTGTSLHIKGEIVESPAKGQSIEIKLEEMEILGNITSSYPFAKKRMNLDTIRTYPHLRARTKTFGCIFRIRSSISFAIHKFLQSEGYLHLDPNIITINECEGGAGVFQITENDLSKKTGKHEWIDDHFGKPSYLTVSSQLHLEAMACALDAVYTFNKSFRSEHSSTHKHLSEFTHLEVEKCFIDMYDLINMSETMIKYLANHLLSNNLEDIETLNNFVSKGIKDRLVEIKNSIFHTLEYSKAIKLLKDNNFKVNYGDDLSSEMEQFITYFYKSPVFITDWPMSIKSFYMEQYDDKCKSFDLLMPYNIGELIGGSMREHDYEKLKQNMDKKNIDSESMKFYLDLREFGTVPHGGFGLGFERLVMLFTGMNNIKDVVPFPVSYKNINY